jgi:hypothetical protein
MSKIQHTCTVQVLVQYILYHGLAMAVAVGSYSGGLATSSAFCGNDIIILHRAHHVDRKQQRHCERIKEITRQASYTRILHGGQSE